jgi:acetyl-CoA acetyltransferase
VGIGATDFSTDSGRSELRLALEAITSALADAAIDPHEVDGLVSYTADNSDEWSVSRNLGLEEVTLFARTPAGGGGACGTVSLAALAVTSGVADVVVCYRALNERSGLRFGQPRGHGSVIEPTSHRIDQSFEWPFGLSTPAAGMALTARRYMHQYGATSEDFGLISVSGRRYAATNPAARFFQRPIAMADHQSSRMISDPLHLLDCCQESDGAVALIITSVERARDLPNPVVTISAGAQGIGPNATGMGQQNRKNIAEATDTSVVARQLWERSGLTPDDIEVANVYDHFTPSVLMTLEALGFCGLGEAPDFIRDQGIGLDGRLPLNTNGGQLGEAYIHGYNGIAEAVRQLRGTAVNQVLGARRAVVTSGSHVPTSGLILERR